MDGDRLVGCGVFEAARLVVLRDTLTWPLKISVVGVARPMVKVKGESVGAPGGKVRSVVTWVLKVKVKIGVVMGSDGRWISPMRVGSRVDRVGGIEANLKEVEKLVPSGMVKEGLVADGPPMSAMMMESRVADGGVGTVRVKVRCRRLRRVGDAMSMSAVPEMCLVMLTSTEEAEMIVATRPAISRREVKMFIMMAL